MSWAALLAQWTEFAAASRAWPRDAQGERWGRSVPEIIRLQAVTHALHELGSLAETEHSLARDRAAVAVTQAAAALDSIWRGESMPESILDTLDDAQRALGRAAWTGMRIAWWPGPGPLEMPDVALAAADLPRTVAMMAPGTPVMPGCPIAWWVGGQMPGVDGCVVGSAMEPLQIYRQFDADGLATEDLVAPLDALPPGMPLLVPLREDGQPLGHFLQPRAVWRAMQEQALAGRIIPLRWDESWQDREHPRAPRDPPAG
jgi:hypothetical protein